MERPRHPTASLMLRRDCEIGVPQNRALPKPLQFEPGSTFDAQLKVNSSLGNGTCHEDRGSSTSSRNSLGPVGASNASGIPSGRPARHGVGGILSQAWRAGVL